MQEIADWLKTLGLSEYAARFAENRIDFSVLRDLTDQDLKDLGVVLGDRRKILRAISDLGGASAVTQTAQSAIPGPIPASAAPPAFPSTAEAAGERRHVTVMFCDLADFDRYRSAARCRGMARRSRCLSRRGFGGSNGDGREGREETRRRADGAVWLSGGAGE